MTKLITKPNPSKKISKPRPDFPLFPHATGRWAKKVRGKLHYFGKVSDDPKGQAALAMWLDQKDDLLAGRTPRVKHEGLTVNDLVNRFLSGKRHLLDTREITHRTFSELFSTCERVGNEFGWDRLVVDLAMDDFDRLRRQIAKRWGPVRLGNEIQRVRSIFKFGFEAGMIESPVRFGPNFKKPSRKVLRKERAKKVAKMIEAIDVKRILAKASLPMKAMTLLGMNCGLGNTDVASLPEKSLNLETGWILFLRPKTGVPRRCPLWPETIIALREALAKRPKPREKAHDDLVFVTKYGHPWIRCGIIKVSEDSKNGDGKYAKEKLKLDDAVSKEFTKILKKLGLHQAGLGFYTLRHIFETIGGETKDQLAVDAIMGHLSEEMAERYRERISDKRLQDVTEYVRQWLFVSDEEKKSTSS